MGVRVRSRIPKTPASGPVVPPRLLRGPAFPSGPLRRISPSDPPSSEVRPPDSGARGRPPPPPRLPPPPRVPEWYRSVHPQSAGLPIPPGSRPGSSGPLTRALPDADRSLTRKVSSCAKTS